MLFSASFCFIDQDAIVGVRVEWLWEGIPATQACKDCKSLMTYLRPSSKESLLMISTILPVAVKAKVSILVLLI